LTSRLWKFSCPRSSPRLLVRLHLSLPQNSRGDSGYTHPFSPAKAVGFHFIPIFNFFWIFAWPSAIADFVNARLGAPLMRGWVVGVGIIAAALSQIFLDAGFGVALLFFHHQLHFTIFDPRCPALAASVRR